MEAVRKSYLSVENLNVSYKQNHVLEDISFQIEEGQFVCVIGPNGGGKSTLLKALVGLLPIRSGKVRKEAKNIGYVPQQLRIDPAVPLRVDEFLSLKLSKRRIWFGPGQTRTTAGKKAGRDRRRSLDGSTTQRIIRRRISTYPDCLRAPGRS